MPWLLIFSLFLSACAKDPRGEGTGPAAKILVTTSVRLDDKVKDKADPLAVLFVIARNEQGQIVAVKKLFPPFQYPLSVALTAEDSMIAGTELSGKLKLTARLDKDGNANPAQAGDILGRSNPEWVQVGDKAVKIVLNEAVQP